ncbi:MAG: hypothetical protein AABW46_04615 [Nanoarchaeota archaeon]
MPQNRKKLIDLLIGNLSNSIVHEILEKAIEDESISARYNKELMISLNLAKKYRERINPVSSPLPAKDIGHIKNKTRAKVRSELLLRISKGYKNINLELVEELVNNAIKILKIV